MAKIFPKLLAFLPWFLWLAVTSDAAPAQTVRASESRRFTPPKDGKRLKFRIGSRSADTAEILRLVREYSADEVMMGSGTQFVSYADFPKVAQPIDKTALEAFRRSLQALRAEGVMLRLSFGREPSVPGEPVASGETARAQTRPYFFDAYPEARNVSTGLLWKLLESKTAELLRNLPEVESAMSYTWETPMVMDTGYFKDVFWADTSKTLHAVNLGPHKYYSDADYLTQSLAALARGAKAAGKEYHFFTFAHYPWQERLNIRAIQQVDRDLPLKLYHFVNAGDWNPYFPNNHVMMEILDRESTVAFDSVGEYWGQAQVPFCYPEEIQQRLVQALERNGNITTISTGTHWAGFSVFGTPNEVNFYAVSRLARDPYLSVERIWYEWAESQFGKQAAPRVISALKRTDEIGKLTFFFHGTSITEHSHIANLDYLEGEPLHLAQAAADWCPDFRTQFLMKEYIERPSEDLVALAVQDRQEALRLNQLSIDDVESVKSALRPEQHTLLMRQLNLQRHFIETTIPYVEAFYRYRLQKRAPSRENRQKIEEALSVLEAKAAAVERVYKEEAGILTGKEIRRFIGQMRTALAAMPRAGATSSN